MTAVLRRLSAYPAGPYYPNVKTAVPVLAILALSWIPLPGGAQQAGAVEGFLSLRAEPARKWVSRYPGKGASLELVDPVPAVVYLTGDLPVAEPSDTPVSMVQEGRHFVPGALAVRTGTVVRFPNRDPFYHNVFSYAGPRFDLGRYPSGESREVVFDEPGVVPVYCEIHEFMRAVVLVTDHRFHAVVGEDGRFRIDRVPPGDYRLHGYHPDLGATEASVSVTENGTTRVTLELGG